VPATSAIQVAVAGQHVTAAIAALRGLGYAHHGQGGVPGREYLTVRSSEGPAVNVHVFSSDSPLASENRIIRDYLRAHPEAAEEYAKAKQRAVEQGCVNLLTYPVRRTRFTGHLVGERGDHVMAA
jgi:GrpB-like predicted nucleotidyltransferase (UPF0157 family)